MRLNPRQFSHREEDTQRSAPKYAVGKKDPPNPPNRNKVPPGSNSKTLPKSDYGDS